MKELSIEEIHEYLQALRRGDVALIKVDNELSRDSHDDFVRFETFLKDNGHPNPIPNDLYLIIERQELVQMLTYAADRNCLGLQYCFGFDKPVYEGGRFLLINKGAIVDRPCESGEYNCERGIYFSDFQVRNVDSPNWYTPHFLNFRINHDLPTSLVNAYINNFNAIYNNYPLYPQPHLTGSVLSVKRLLSILTDASTILGTTQFLTLRWGITDYKPTDNDKPELGNFTLVIGTGDVSRGPVVERRTVRDKFLGDRVGDCPPRTPC